MEPIWVRPDVAIAIQRSLTTPGSLEGRCDPRLLEAALARPSGLRNSLKPPSLPRLAAAYSTGILSNRPFARDNARMAFIIAAMFLYMNGVKLTASQEDRALTFRSLSEGVLSEEPLAQWFEWNTAPR